MREADKTQEITTHESVSVFYLNVSLAQRREDGREANPLGQRLLSQLVWGKEAKSDLAFNRLSR